MIWIAITAEAFNGLMARVMFNKEATQMWIRAMRAANSGQLQLATGAVIRTIQLVQPTEELGQIMGDRARKNLFPSGNLSSIKPQPLPPPVVTPAPTVGGGVQ